jgi:hypothetical protein
MFAKSTKTGGAQRAIGPICVAASAGIAVGTLVMGSLSANTTSLAPVETSTVSLAAAPLDPEVILPSRVDAALHRLLDAVDRATAGVDDARLRPALRALNAATLNVKRSHLAARRQLEATPPPDDESESTAGPDSVIATLNVEQGTITEITGLFDDVTDPGTVAALTHTLNTTLNKRAILLRLVIALDPEEAGAPYADGMADTVDFYTDEVDSLSEALRDDTLTRTSSAAITNALAKSEAARAAVTKAFGGGD